MTHNIDTVFLGRLQDLDVEKLTQRPIEALFKAWTSSFFIYLRK